MARTNRKTRSKGISVNFKGVEGKLSAITEGEYQAKVLTVTQEEGQAADYLKWEFELEGDGVDGRKVYLNTSLAPQALWNLRGLLEALGVEVPDDEMDIDPTELEGMPIGLLIENETYEGKKRPRVADYFPAEEDAKPSKKKKKSKAVEEDDDEDEDDKPKKQTRAEKRRAAKAKSEEDDDDEDEKPVRKSRRSRDEDDEEDEDTKKSSRRSRGKSSRDDDDEDEEDEKPTRKSSKKKSKGPSEDEVNDMSEEELEELIEESELDVDLQKVRTLTKKRNMVIDALGL